MCVKFYSDPDLGIVPVSCKRTNRSVETEAKLGSALIVNAELDY